MANNKDFKVKNGIQPTVYNEGVGTVTSGSVGYYLSSTSYDSASFSLTTQTTLSQAMSFNDDGTKLFVLGYNTDANVYQYSLSTAYDITTVSYDSVSYDVSTQGTNTSGLCFNSDGTKMFVLFQTGDKVSEYTLSTGFDLSSTVTFVDSFSVLSQGTNPYALAFSTDGTKMYMSDATIDSIFEYDLNTGFDVSTASYNSVSLSTTAQGATNVRDIVFNSDGTKMYITGSNSDSVFQYNLTTGFDLSTASYSSISYSVFTQTPAPIGMRFKPDGTKMYILGNEDVIYQYSTSLNTRTLDLSTGSVFEITPTSDVQVSLSNPAASGTVSQATLLLDGGSSAGYDLSNGAYSNNFVDTSSVTTSAKKSEFSADGTKLYVTNASTADVDIYQYDLSTAYDVSTATYNSVYFDPTGQSAYIQGFRFKPDGTKMYVLGTSSNVVYQYSLSTAWDLSTTSYDSVSLSINAQEIYPQDIAFKTDGTKMFLAGNSGDDINQYSLSTAWDLSTASFDSVTFSVATQTTGPDSLEFNANGDKVFVLGDNTVYQYSLSTAWSISTASYDSVSFDTSAQDGAMRGLRFKPDGRKMYLTGDVEDRVYEYNTATPATITYPSTVEWPSGTAPTSPAIGDTDVITFSTTDGGTTYQAVQAIDGAK